MALDYRAFPFMYVDVEPDSLLAVRDALHESFNVMTAATAAEALTLLAQNDVAVMLTEQHMPDMSGVELCHRAHELRPNIVCLLTTRALDLNSAIDAINHGQIGGFLAKPWSDQQLERTLRHAIDPLQAQRAQQSMEMRLWHGGQVAAATTIYEELVHELSNPLGALEINASLVSDLLLTMLHDGAIAKPLRDSLENAAEAHNDSLAAIDQMKSLVSRMRQGRRPHAIPTRGACVIARVVDATVRIVRAEIEKVAHLDVQLDSSPTATMDASVLGQVLLNLLLNAAQAVLPEARMRNRIRVQVGEGDGYARLSVIDNGPGIPPDNLDRVFDPFFTTKENGTGLGLAICRELVSQAHGTISVSSGAGGGARFVVAIPLSLHEAM
jgi:two-component system NtrC family sensor kinase